MPTKHPMKIAFRSKQQIAEAHAKARNRGRKKPSELFQQFLDALPLHPLSDPETVTLPSVNHDQIAVKRPDQETPGSIRPPKNAWIAGS